MRSAALLPPRFRAVQTIPLFRRQIISLSSNNSTRTHHHYYCSCSSSSSSSSIMTTPTVFSSARMASTSSNITDAAAAAASSSGTSSNAADVASAAEASYYMASSTAATSAATAAAAASSSAATSTTAAAAASSSAAAVLPTPTLVKAMDTIWSTLAGFVTKIIPDVSPFLDFGVSTLVATQATLGLPWSTVFFLFGICVRASTLYFTMYGERASLRMQLALPELKTVYQKFEMVYYDPATTTKELQRVSTALKEQQAVVYKKHGTSNRASLVSLCSGPIFVYGFWVAMRTTGVVPEVAATSWNWIPSLAIPDPYFVLPCAVIGMTVVNFELLFAKKGGASGTGVSANIVAAARIAALSCLWVVSNFRSAVLLYWAGVSCTGLLQPILMNTRAFQKLFKVPSDDELKGAVAEARAVQQEVHEATAGAKTPTQAFIEKLRETRTQAKSGVTVSSSQPKKMSSSYGIDAARPGPLPPKTSVPVSSASAVGTPAYRILKASELEQKQKMEQQQKEDGGGDDDPLMQRFMMSMPSVAQGVANPEKSQKLADDIQSYNDSQMQEAQKQQRRSWKTKTK